VRGPWLAAALALAASCAPFYRVDELRARGADDAEERARLRRSADARLAAGDGAGAAAAYGALLELAPASSADVYLALAQARALAGERAAARAAARFGLEHASPPDGTSRELRQLLARLYAEDGLYEAALQHLPDATLEGALRVPALAKELAPLADAVGLARRGQGEAALLSYEAFVSAHGLPAHPALRRWSRPIVTANAALFRQLRAAEEAPGPEDAWAAAALRYHAGELQDLPGACALTGGGAPDAESARAAREADEALSRNVLGGALRGWRQAVALSPCWAGAHWNLALLLAREEQHGEALEHARAFLALSRDPALTARARAFITREAQLADPAQARALKETEARVSASLLEQRLQARTWRGRGTALLLTAASVGLGAAAFGVLGAQQNGRVKAGGFATAADIQGAVDAGQAWNLSALGLAAVAGVLGLAGAPMVLFNLGPAEPTEGAGGSEP
jgi:hypothetical protein